MSSGKQGGSRASDEDSKTAVKVGMFPGLLFACACTHAYFPATHNPMR